MVAIRLGAADDGRVVPASVGDEIVVTLEENATTGYRWQVGGVGDVVSLVSDGYAGGPPADPPGGAVLGRGGLREFHLAVQAPGRAELVLTLGHEWEVDGPTIARVAVSLEVT